MKTSIPHLYEKKGWYYHVRKVAGRMIWVALGTKDYAEALKKWAVIEGNPDAAPSFTPKPDALTFSACIPLYLDSVKGKIAINTLKAYTRVLSELQKAFGDRLLEEITRGAIIDYHAGLAAIPYEANLRVRVLHSVLQYAVDREYIATNPAFKVKKFKERRHDLKLTAAILFNEIYPAADPMLQRAIMLAFHLGGQHEQEVKSLTWANVDTQNRVFKLKRRKTGEIMVIDYSDNETFAAYIEAQRAARTDLCPYLVYRTTDTGFAPYQTFRREWEKALDRAGLPEHAYQFKEIRHLANTLMNAAGIPVYERMKMTGHKSIAVNERYTHDTGGETRRAGAVLSQFGNKEGAA